MEHSSYLPLTRRYHRHTPVLFYFEPEVTAASAAVHEGHLQLVVSDPSEK